MNKEIKMNCQDCKTKEPMIPTKITRFSKRGRVFWWAVVIFISMASVCMVFGIYPRSDGLFYELSKMMRAKVIDPFSTLSVIGMSFFLLLGAVVGGIVLYLLLNPKKVYKCVQCDSTLSRR